MNLRTQSAALLVWLSLFGAWSLTRPVTSLAQAGGADTEETLAERIADLATAMTERETELADLRKRLSRTEDSVAADALRSLTGERWGTDADAWSRWWESRGSTPAPPP